MTGVRNRKETLSKKTHFSAFSSIAGLKDSCKVSFFPSLYCKFASRVQWIRNRNKAEQTVTYNYVQT